MSVNDHRTEPTTEVFSVLGSGDEYSSTFIFGNEDHTLGNALRHLLMQHDDKVDFCGYSVPHPYEPKMHIRLQMQKSSGLTATSGLRQGLKDLEETANIIDDHFIDALQKFHARKKENGDSIGKKKKRVVSSN